MRLSILLCLLCCASTLCFAQYQNIRVSGVSDPNETSICINPKNPAQIVAGANISARYLSADTGNTWTAATVSSTYGVWGDPVVDVDTAGTFYYFHLSNPDHNPNPYNNPFAPHWIDRIVCQKVTFPINPLTITNGTYTGLDSPKKQDKPWVVINRSTNTIYVTWTQFDHYGTSNPSDSSVILFSKSTDTAHTWSTPVRICTLGGDCVDDDNTVEGATPVVGADGKLYVVWAGHDGIFLNKSLDDGATWMPQEQMIATQPGGWDYSVPGVQRCNGLPFAVCDLSNGPHRGTLYVNWSDQRNGTNNTDVFLIKSTDNGLTWSTPLRVNNDTGIAHQFMNSVAVDSKTGYVYCLFYDRRNYSNNLTDVYVAVSKDGGATFINEKVSATPFAPNTSVFLGDYIQVAAYNNIVRPFWTRIDAGSSSVWTAKVNGAQLSAPLASPAAPMLGALFPNPVTDESRVMLRLAAGAQISCAVTDMLGRYIAVIKDGEWMDAGNHEISLAPEEWHLAPGTYFLSVSDGQHRAAQQFVVK